MVVHTARSWTEAVVVRGLLESVGIKSPELGAGSPSPWPDLVPMLHLLHGIEIYALESHAGRARELIAEYLGAVEQDAERGAERDQPDDPIKDKDDNEGDA